MAEILTEDRNYIWLFKGDLGSVGGVFTVLAGARDWIARHGLTGWLVHYPVDQGVSDWLAENGYISRERQNTADQSSVGNCTSASQAYFIFELGKCLNWPELDELSTEQLLRYKPEYYPTYPS